MNPISVRLSSKNQITVPKTVRNMIGVMENDSVSFVFEDGKVYMEKTKSLTICPFCRGEDFYGEPCEVCDGEGTVEDLDKSMLISKLYPIFLSRGAILTIDTRKDLYVLKIETELQLLEKYKEHFQMEFIKLVLKDLKVKDLLNQDLKEELSSYLNFRSSKENLSKWWDSMITRHT